MMVGNNNYGFTSAQRERCRVQLKHSESFWTTWPPLAPTKKEMLLYTTVSARARVIFRNTSSGPQAPGETRPPRRFQHQNVRASEAGPGGGVFARNGSREEGRGQIVLAFVAGCCDCVCVCRFVSVCVSLFRLFSFL